MSVWTHVSGSIRLDPITLEWKSNIWYENGHHSIEQLIAQVQSKIKEIFEACEFRGSEDGIKYETTYTIDTRCNVERLTEFNIVLYGDLRDVDKHERNYATGEALVSWWKRLTDTLNQALVVRMGSIYVETNDCKGHTYIYNMDGQIRKR